MARKTTISLDTKLIKEARARLEGERELELETYIEIHLRVMLRNKTTLQLKDKLPFGKYAGEIVENIVRADPAYINWLTAQNGKTNFAPAVLVLLEEILAKGD